jgi:hypothetical protein
MQNNLRTKMRSRRHARDLQRALRSGSGVRTALAEAALRTMYEHL